MPEGSERERFDHLLETRQYLKSSRIGGRHLRYIAEVDGQWVALLTFSGAAPKHKGREKWIAWSPRQQARRLGLVCNNSRFLLLMERERHPNLASKILCRPRLPESLREAEADIAGPCPFRAAELGSLYERLRQLEDPRKGGHGLHHRLTSTFACAIVATLMGAGSYQAYEDVCKKLTQRQRRALRCHYNREKKHYDIPSDSTFFRVLNLVDPAHFESITAGWLFEQDPSQIEQLAVDGKVLRGTGRTDGKPLALLSLVTHQLRTTLRSVAIEEKSNEPSRREASEIG